MDAIKAVADSAQIHITWALSIIGGTVAMILGTSHLRPQLKWVRFAYLLFIPGWILLGISILYGDKVSRGHIAAKFVSSKQIRDIAKTMNANYEIQQSTLMVGTAIFLLWLILYLIWWIFFRQTEN